MKNIKQVAKEHCEEFVAINNQYNFNFTTKQLEAFAKAVTAEFVKEQEPVAWIANDAKLPLKEDGSYWLYPDKQEYYIPLYLHPSQDIRITELKKQIYDLNLNKSNLQELCMVRLLEGKELGIQLGIAMQALNEIAVFGITSEAATDTAKEALNRIKGK